MVSAQVALAGYKVKKKAELAEIQRNKYEQDPVLWITERAKGFMYSKLREIAMSVVFNRRTAVPSAHEIGKSWVAARIAAWWIAAHPPGSAFVVTTAPSAKQVKVVLWKEIRRAFVAANLNGRLNQTEWWLNGEMVAMGRKPNDYDPTAFQGIHAKFVLVILDEGCGIPEDIYIAANSLVANEFGRILVIGNPDDPDSHFAKVCNPGSGWQVIPVSAFDTPNFTEEEAPQEVKDVLVGPIYVEEMRRDVGEESAVYVSKVLGKFPVNKIDGVILLSWIRKCQTEDFDIDTYSYEDLIPVELGVDVGAGKDETSIRERRGIVAGRYWEEKTPDPEDAFRLIIPVILETNATRVKLDIIGIGWGLLGLLRSAALRGNHINEMMIGTNYEDVPFDVSNVEFVGVNVGQASTDPTRFLRLRSQLWWEVGRNLSVDCAWDLSLLDEMTVSQLIRPTWTPDLANRIVVESKKDTMKRTNQPSPNRADALLLAFCEPPQEDTEYIITTYDPVQIGPDI